MHFAYVGDFNPPHSTENHVAKALENNGHEVTRWLERPWEWPLMVHRLAAVDKVDVILWTSTNDYAPPETFDDQRSFVYAARQRDIPVVGYHLDLWWGLSREHLIFEKPWFRNDLLCTADGGHDDRWADAKIEHTWFPPGILGDWAHPGTVRDGGMTEAGWRWEASDLAFVGSWRGGYHRESTHRHELISWLKQNYGDRCKFWPPKGEHRIEGEAKNDLYASTKIIIGDSCMVPHLKNYWSDRVPDVTGRGGFLLHPEVDGLQAEHAQVVQWPAGEWDLLGDAIEAWLSLDHERSLVAENGWRETSQWHTYERRMNQLVEELTRREML